jgi:WhiB family redox-sensing transcriptional regulator
MLQQPLRRAVDTWAERAACKGVRGTMHLDGGGNGVVAEAKAICATCPVTAQCLAHALEQDEDRGVWGGLTPNERAAIRDRQRRTA